MLDVACPVMRCELILSDLSTYCAIFVAALVLAGTFVLPERA